MKVAIFFARDAKPIRKAIFGRYLGGGFLFVGNPSSESKIDSFYSHAGEEFSRRDFSEISIKKWSSEGTETEFLMLSVDEEEARKIRALCEACAATHKPFNLHDKIMNMMPFWNPEEISIFNAATINNTQAIILILRECLNPDNPLKLGLNGLHSRMAFLENLYDRFAPYALPVLWSNLVTLT